MINLPTHSTNIVGDTHIIIAPAVRAKSPHIIVGFLPKLSARGPEESEPQAAPSKAILTII